MLFSVIFRNQILFLICLYSGLAIADDNKSILKLENKPVLVETVANFNIVKYANKFYGIPQGKEINLENTNPSKIKELIIGQSIFEVKSKILDNPYSWKPILLESFLNYNIVSFKNTLYGVPHGYKLDFYENDLVNNNNLIINNYKFFIKIEILTNKTFQIIELFKKKINYLLF